MIIKLLGSFFARFCNQVDYGAKYRASRNAKILVDFFDKYGEISPLFLRLRLLPETDDTCFILADLTRALAVCDKLYNIHSTAFWGIWDFGRFYSALEGCLMSSEEVAAGVELIRFWGDGEARWRDVEMEAVSVLESVLMAKNLLFEYETLSAGENRWKKEREER